MGIEKHEELRQRTKPFALRVMNLADALPRSRSASKIADQILRSGMSVAANYRAAGRGRSKAEFIAKMSITVEEADETVFWLEILSESGIVPPRRLNMLLDEARQLRAILETSRKTARS